MGSVVLSVDAELGWGFHDEDDPPTERVDAARRGWLALLHLLDRYEVPATWAVVGHLWLDRCDGVHADHPAPEGWFGRDRGPEALPAELRFGRELTSCLLEADVPHDIGAHSFSHVEFGDPDTTPALARAEVSANLDAADRVGVSPTSFVFPRNSVGYREVLAAYGMTCYRGPEPLSGWRTGTLHPFRKLARATMGSAPPLVTPYVDTFGLVDVPASLYLFGFEDPARLIVEPIIGDPIVKQARVGIDRAAAEPGVFHMWLHPNNLVTGRDEERLRAIFEYLDRRREDASLRVETMADVARRVRADAVDRSIDLQTS